jgi:hypothetical protein
MYEYMKLLHRDVNHLGSRKLSAIASKVVLGPRMYSTASDVVSRCATCLQCMDAVLLNSPPAGTTRAKVPWQSLSIDVMHIPLSNGLQYILMCSDNASSYIWAFPLCTQDAKSIINKIDKEIFQVYGAYKEIEYDGAQQLCSVKMAGFLKMWDLRCVQVHIGQKNSNRCKGDISRPRKAMKKVLEDSARSWPRDIKRVLINLNSSPIPAWKSTIMPFEIMFHRTPRILARPSLPEYQGMTQHLQEMAEGQTCAQDICRELCECTPHGTNPGSGPQTPEALKIVDLVLVMRNIVATNKVNSVLKLTRIYSSKAYKVTLISGHHVSAQVNGGSHVYHRKRLRKVFQQD